ncbi:hypothetical protein ISS37_03285 [candidate division KSB1 bacterium]|nr:hypothetical protein [candidate division KSB1 bacterium]
MFRDIIKYFIVLVYGLPMVSTGTLIVIIPTQDGIVIAGDSRSTVGGSYIDGQEKICFVENIVDLSFTMTGFTRANPPPPQNVGLLSWYEEAPLLYDGKKIMHSYLKEHKTDQINENFLMNLSRILIDTLTKYFNQSPAGKETFKGNDICKPVIVKYDYVNNWSTVATFEIAFNSIGALTLKNISIETLSASDKRCLYLFGEVDYVINNVFNGEGREFLVSNFNELYDKPIFIGDMKSENASIIAKSIIDATSKISGIIPIPSGIGIGGTPSIYLIDGKNNPKRIF